MKINVNSHKAELKSLFSEIFSESIFFTNLIFSEQLNNAHCFAIKEDNKIVSFLFGIEKKIKIKDKTEKCIYIYGVGTKNDYRGKGCMRKLLDEAYKYFADKNILFLYLVPANEQLFSMYEKLGYKTEFYLDKASIKLEKSADIEISDGDYFSDYQSFSQGFDNIILNSKKDIMTTLNYTKYIKINESSFLYEEDGKTVHIRECFIKNEEDLENLLLYFGNRFETAIITKSGSLVPYAMIKPYNNFSLQGSRYTNMNFD